MDLDWAAGLKPGDYIATCEGCNRQIAKVESAWTSLRKAKVLYNFRFTDTKGRLHHFPGCVYSRETVEEINQYYLGFAESLEKDPTYLEKDPTYLESYFQMRKSVLKKAEAIKAGHPIVDEFGEFLPEFDYEQD